MIITNKTGLPEILVAVAKMQTHKKGDYSVTELEKSPREFWLITRHDHEIEVDVKSMGKLLAGIAWHKLLQEGAGKNQLAEEYLTMEIAGKVLSGTADLYDNGKITDNKTTSVFTLIYDSRSVEWSRQVNAYAYLFRKHGFEVNKLKIFAYLRDWQKSKAQFNSDYPQADLLEIDIEMNADKLILEYITERINIIEAHKNTPDKDLPLCTDKECWRKDPFYRCMKAGQVKSKKNFYVNDDIEKGPIETIETAKNKAEAYCAENKLTLLEVPGECVKCGNYCYASSFCSQFLQGSPPPVNDFDATLNAAKAKFAAPEATLEMLLEDANGK
jgi:hypothetical protein